MDGTTPDLGGLARLKERYGFTLFADEAHSLIGVGSTGKGCVERWNETDSQQPVPPDLIDIRVATLSKALGTTGGVVCGLSAFENRIRSRLQVMTRSGLEVVTTTACVKTILTLSRTSLVSRNLLRLQAMAIFCRRCFQQAGIYVYGGYDSPILPLFAGRPTRATKLSQVLRQFGIIATPVSAPAVPFWESRVRMCLSAAFEDEVVHELVRAVVQAAGIVGLCKTTSNVAEAFSHHDIGPTQQGSDQIARSTKSVKKLIMQCAAANNAKPIVSQTCSVGCAVLRSYGLGSGGARWIVGTTDLHLRLERSISEIFQRRECLTYPDAYVGLMSTVAALCRPVDGFNGHDLYVKPNAAPAIEDGIRVAPRRRCPTLKHYRSLKLLSQQLRHCRPSGYVTIVVDRDELPDIAAMSEMFTHPGSPCRTSNTTILVYDDSSITDLARWSCSMKSIAARLLMYGSFHREFQSPGSFLVGDAVLIEELRYTSRGYMFATSQEPYITAMINEELVRSKTACFSE